MNRWATCCAVWLGAWGAPLATLAQSSQPDAPVLLTNVLEIIRLSTNELGARRYEAQIQGVIIWVSIPMRRLYVQEGAEALPVEPVDAVGKLRVGQRVEVRGRVTASTIRHRVTRASLEVLGEGTLPDAVTSTVPRMVAGKDAMHWTQARGIVRDMVITQNRELMLKLTDQDEVFSVKIQEYNRALPRHWMDSEIEVLGFSYPYNDELGRPSTFNFMVQSTNFVRIVRPGQTNLFERPLLSISEAARRPEQWHPMVKIAGTVVFQRDELLYIANSNEVARVVLLLRLQRAFTFGGVEFEPQTPLEPGERVEVIGAPVSSYSLAPTFIHGEFRRLGRGADLAPTPVTCQDLRSGRQGGRLVSIEARLLDHRGWAARTTHHRSFVLQAGDEVFQARWEHKTPVEWNLQPNAYVRVTGVNDAQRGQFNAQPTFELLLRSPADIVPAPEPPYWTQPGVRRPLAAAAVVTAIALGVLLLQRLHVRRLEAQVARRTADLSDSNTRLQREVGARERAEDELRVALAAEKELNQLKGSFVAMVSHEFRTPLEVILSSSHILDRYLDRLPPEKRREQLDAIRASVHRMSGLMEDILLLGKFEAARMTCQPAPADLAALCRRCVNEILSATDAVCPVHLVTEGLAETACLDESLLGPILTNLLSNAVKYSAPGQPVELRVARRGIEAEIVVQDRGRGIPADDQPRLFTAFYRAGNVGNVSGSGLGLVIVQRCVDLHQGSLEFVSREGAGSKFTVRLPLFDPSRFPTAAESTDARLERHGPGRDDNLQPNSP